MNEIETAMFNSGWVRCPNNPARWYAGSAGKLEPVFPLELRVTDAIWLVTSPYGNLLERKDVPLMRFDNPASLEEYLSRNGKKAEAAAPFSNSWD